MENKTVCFFGHRKIKETEELKAELCKIIEKLILENSVDTFLFGSKSQFNSLCHKLVSVYKEKYLHIKRVYVRAEYPFINADYENFLLENYEVTYFPKRIINSGKAIYIERNIEMINESDFCVVFYDEKNLPLNRKSGTKIALEYAEREKKPIIKLNT